MYAVVWVERLLEFVRSFFFEMRHTKIMDLTVQNFKPYVIL